MVEKYDELYKRDSKGVIRVWWMERDGDKYRAMSGTKGGKITESGWKVAEPKNVGRSNETTGEQQVISEIQSQYEKKSNQGRYSRELEAVDEEKYFKPMLAEKYVDVKARIQQAFDEGTRVFSQPKLDGFRSVNQKDGMFSRGGKVISSSPHVLEAMATAFRDYPDVVFDGELYNHEFAENFNKLSSLVAKKKPTDEDLKESREKVQVHLYDMFDPLFPDSLFSERVVTLNLLKSNGFFDERFVKIVPTVEVHSFEDIDREYGQLLEANYEGQIIRIDAPYTNKRTKDLIKRKEFFDAEYTIKAFEAGVGNWAGKVKRVHYVTDDGLEFSTGIKGSMEELAQLLLEKDEYVGGQGTVRYPNLTPDGKPRFGVTYNWYKGKRPL